MMKLNETVKMMNSADYKERFQAEYNQLAIRYYGLKNMLEKWDAGTLSFKPTCPRSTYNMQIKAMTDYLAVLEARAVMEGIKLSDVNKDNACKRVGDTVCQRLTKYTTKIALKV